jgi:hypothetical protein
MFGMSSDTPTDTDKEILAMAQISAALQALDDPTARQRVLSYVLARFAEGEVISTSARIAHGGTLSHRTDVAPARLESPSSAAKEIPGIGRLTEDGQLRITIRDLKAKSGLDAATRLAHVSIYAWQQLTGEPMSSRRTLTPILKEWRLYDGNTRHRLAVDRGILRDGDNLTLDAHARADAEHFMEEILNPEMQGSWRPR